jgi:peptidoglycan/xylan/chitin deacetylase (PgdA/CDA1 family)
MAVQLHGWQHDDLSTSQRGVAELPQALKTIHDLLGVRPTILYPPWNKTSPFLEASAQRLGLRVNPVKVSLDYFIRRGGRVKNPTTLNFHYWADEVALLPAAFALARQPRPA